MRRRKGDSVRVRFKKKIKSLSVWGRESREDDRIRNNKGEYKEVKICLEFVCNEYMGNR